MSQIEKIKQVAPLLEVARKRIHGLKEGPNGDWVALCPFHTEKDPSFRVNPKTNKFHCFGCGKQGDVINFISEFESIELSAAVRLLSIEYNLQTRGAAKPVTRSPYQVLCSELVTYYRKCLSEAKEVLRYLEKRGVTQEIQERFQIGYCPPRGNYMPLLSKANVSLQQALEWHIFERSLQSGKAYNPLWDRIVFPICSPESGDPVSFAGRCMDENPAKYKFLSVNSHFKKNDHLYGFKLASPHIRKAQKVIVTEGFFDVTAMHQAGFSNTAGTLGTALSSGHLALIRSVTSHIVFLFDGDTAGEKAAREAAFHALQAGFKTLIAMLPGNEDPDEVLQDCNGREIIETAIERAEDGLVYWLLWHLDNSSPLEIKSWIDSLLSGAEDLAVKVILNKKIDLFFNVLAKPDLPDGDLAEGGS